MNFEDVIATIPKDSWLLSWNRCWPKAESPKSFITLSGMVALGACIGRKVWFLQDFFTIYPMLNILCIGPSGVGKTAALEYMALPLIRAMPEEFRPQLIEGKLTPQKLFEDLVAAPHAVLYAEELAALFTKEKYMESMIPAVTKLLNYLEVLEERTKSGGTIKIEKPSVIVAGGSTPEWLQDQLPDSATSGGFLARFLICYEQYKGQRVALPRHSMSKAAWKDLTIHREEVAREFQGLVKQTGEADFDGYEAQDVYVEWYNNLKPTAGHLAPFAARGGEFVQRLAILIALSRNSLLLQPEDIKCAITIWTYCNERLNEVVVPLTGKGKLLAQILKIIGNQEMSEQAVCRLMRNYEGTQEVQRLISGLLFSGDLVKIEGHLKRGYPQKEGRG